MEYHKDRFVDNSLLFYENNRLFAASFKATNYIVTLDNFLEDFFILRN